jgi:Holliday junction DNA helicase RuvA
MIGQLRGKILAKQPPQLLIDVNGVGYEIDASMNTFYSLPEVGQEVLLFAHLVVREDAHLLYGFYTQEEKSLFRVLLKVNGVGPRLALTILSSMEPNHFVQNIINNDTTALTRMPGIGKKTAERLVIEMRDKLSGWQSSPSIERSPMMALGGRRQTTQDAVAALIALGYKPQQANTEITKIDDGNMSSEELIRSALREMA